MKETKFPVTNQFLDLKSMVKSGKIDLKIFDKSSRELINHLGSLTLNGVKVVEDIDINLWKDRVWFLVEKVGLLPPLSKHEMECVEEVGGNDDWYKPDTEFDYDENIEI